MRFSSNPLTLFGFLAKEEKPVLPPRFYLIRYSSQAKKKGTFDNHNKIVEIYRKGKKTEEHPYSEELINALEEIEEMPGTEEKFEDELFEFDEVANFGYVEFRK